MKIIFKDLKILAPTKISQKLENQLYKFSLTVYLTSLGTTTKISIFLNYVSFKELLFLEVLIFDTFNDFSRTIS